MKLLVSAYACEPDKGSEPAVGWNWVQALVRRGYQVHVITRGNNREPIERSQDAVHPRLTFHYFDLSQRARVWKHAPGGIYVYYLFWQIGAYRLAKDIHAREHFDRVHHVTFASFRQPSFMGRLGIPFLFGPIGGGEAMPPLLRRGLSFSGRVAETLREIGGRFVMWDPLMHAAFRQAETIVCTTDETAMAIPRRYRGKCVQQLAIGINNDEIVQQPEHLERRVPSFLFIGRLLYWKGLHLLFDAFSKVMTECPGVALKVIGVGPDREWLKNRAKAAGVDGCVEWVSSILHSEIDREYGEHTALVFPSLHDSGGMVVLEALASGMPVICLDLGGPGRIADSSCAIAVEARTKTEEQVVSEIADAMIRIARDAKLRASFSQNALQRAQQLTWDRAAANLYDSIDARRNHG